VCLHREGLCAEGRFSVCTYSWTGHSIRPRLLMLVKIKNKFTVAISCGVLLLVFMLFVPMIGTIIPRGGGGEMSRSACFVIAY
jgi:hypothetical protein